MKTFGSLPGAVVIGGDFQGLGIAQSLGRHGIPVVVVDDEYSISRFCRYVKHSVRVPDLRNEQASFECLFDIGKHYQLRNWVLFPTRDELVATVSRHKDALSEWFLVPTPSWDTVQWIWDKRNTYRLAHELGIAYPRTHFPRTVEDVDQIECSFPVAIKPAIKEHFFYATRAKAWRADSRAELCQLFERASNLAGPGEIMIQEFVPGGGAHQFAYCAFFKDGGPIGKMFVRRRRQHPHDFGRASTYVETLEAPELEELSKRFLQAVDYYGLVEVEFKQDPRDGQMKLLDVNARTWGYHTLGRVAGVDFPYLLYRDQIGESVEPVCGLPGRSWMRLLTDFPTALFDILHGRLSLGEYARSLRNVNEFAAFSWNDPLPGIVECMLLPYLLVRRGF
jgi:predicted ATP-grasp superfamily ATP-dependent carboligase